MAGCRILPGQLHHFLAGRKGLHARICLTVSKMSLSHTHISRVPIAALFGARRADADGGGELTRTVTLLVYDFIEVSAAWKERKKQSTMIRTLEARQLVTVAQRVEEG